MASKYEVKVIAGEYAGKWIGVDSLQAAIEEFGSNGFERSSFREAEYYQVILNDPSDGAVVWMNDCTKGEAQKQVAELFSQGRSAEYRRYHHDDTIV